MTDFFTVNELSREFRVNPKTIYRMLWAKGIPPYKVGSAGHVPIKKTRLAN